ncbi:MAG: chemotaxis protein CheW [Candidatus Hodarchaeota archaeon]
MIKDMSPLSNGRKENSKIKAKREELQLGTDTLLQFTLKGIKFSFHSSSIIQLLQKLIITPVANSAPYIVGSTTFQGEVLPVIDLQTFFYGESLTKDSGMKVQEGNYIVATDNKQGESFIVFQVESVLGVITKPPESQIIDLVSLADPSEYSYFKKAFIFDEEIIIQVSPKDILSQIKIELDHFQTQFLAENKDSFIPIELPLSLDKFNIDLKHKLSISPPSFGTKLDKAVSYSRESQLTATLVSVQDYNILIPNKRIVEIFSVSNVTEVPNASKAVMGAVNFRGSVISLVNLSKLLETNSSSIITQQKTLDENSNTLVFDISGQFFALFVDEIKEVIEVNQNDIMPSINPMNSLKADYIFEGAVIDTDGQILLVLDVDYIFNRCLDPHLFKSTANQIVSFEDNRVVTIDKKSLIRKEGIIFEDNGNKFFLDSDFVIQVIEPNSILLKGYSKTIIGATVHSKIVPLIDFCSLLGDTRIKKRSLQESIAILVKDRERNLEVAFLVDKVLDKISTENLEAFQLDTGLAEKVLSSLVSGFFSHQDDLGMIINPSNLVNESYSLLKNELNIEDIEKDFSSTLQLDEMEFLEKVQASRKELELLLFYHQEGIRLDYFVFRLEDILLAIDVDNVRVVFRSLEIQSLSSEYYPVIGTTLIEGEKLPILDLKELILSLNDSRKKSEDIFFFSLIIQDKIFLIPVNTIEGVITTFKEELIPCETPEIFLEGKEVCQYMFNNANLPTSVYIIENDFLSKIIEQKGVNSVIIKLNEKIKNKKE